VRRFDFQGAVKYREGDLLDLKSGPCGEKAYGGLVRQRAGPRGARRLNVEFLKHLHRQRSIVLSQQRNCALPLERVGGVPADRVEQDVRVEKMWQCSDAAAVNIIAGKPIGRVEVGYVLAQFALLPLQPLDFGFFRGKINQKAPDER
jgi:hypothetical protein